MWEYWRHKLAKDAASPQMRRGDSSAGGSLRCAESGAGASLRRGDGSPSSAHVEEARHVSFGDETLHPSPADEALLRTLPVTEPSKHIYFKDLKLLANEEASSEEDYDSNASGSSGDLAGLDNLSVQSTDGGASEAAAESAQLARQLSTRSERRRKPKRVDRQRLIVILVGLPARGKTFLCNKLMCYLNWLGHPTRHFNVGKYRRKQRGPDEVQDADFFDIRNAHGQEARQRALIAALDDMEAWLETDSAQVAIFDATNTSVERRNFLRTRFHGKWQYIFIESICNDPEVLEQNYRLKLLYSPDYKYIHPDQAMADFKERIGHYEEVYETITDRSIHYIKLIDMVTGRGYMDLNRISGYIPGKMVFFLMQVCRAGTGRPRRIWLTRHGESEYNVQGKIGGNSSLSPRGRMYARLLPDILMDRVPTTLDGTPLPVAVWTSTLNRTIMTASGLPFPKLQWKALDEIQAGTCDGMTYEEMFERMPEEYELRKKDKLSYRYPSGESYMDVIQRLEPVVTEVERERECVCIVAHQAVLRALYGYFMNRPLEEVPRLEIPLHTVMELIPKADGTMAETRFYVNVDKALEQEAAAAAEAAVAGSEEEGDSELSAASSGGLTGSLGKGSLGGSMGAGGSMGSKGGLGMMRRSLSIAELANAELVKEEELAPLKPNRVPGFVVGSP